MKMNQYLNANTASTKPARFSTEIEGEGMELLLRGLLMACLLTALAVCNAHLGNDHHALPSLPDNGTAVACVNPAAPVAKL